MSELDSFNSLTDAAAWLSEDTGRSYSERWLLEQGDLGNISLLARNPDWRAPGVGELNLVNTLSMKPVDVVATDGLVSLTPWVIQTLRKHGNASLANLELVVGEASFIVAPPAPSISKTDVRVRRSEMLRLRDAVKSSIQATAPALNGNAEQSAPSTEDSNETGCATEKTGRTDNLKRAIFDAWTAGLSVDSTASEVFDHLAQNDQTGFIRGRDRDELQWENTSGQVSRTGLRALANRLTPYRKEFKKKVHRALPGKAR